jgi:hypothetical protein
MREVRALVLVGIVIAIPSARPAHAQPGAEMSTAELWTRSAHRAALSGDCTTVEILGRRVAAVSAAHHARVFVVDPAIARCLSPPPAPPPPDLRHGALGTKVGLGIGAPYGGEAGFGAEVGLPHVGLVAAMGIAGRSLGWSVGVRGHLRDRFASVRPHVTALYGTTAVYVERVWSETGWQQMRHALHGFGAYAGADIDIGDPGSYRLAVAVGVSWQSDAPVDVVDRSRVAPSFVVGVDHEW